MSDNEQVQDEPLTDGSDEQGAEAVTEESLDSSEDTEVSEGSAPETQPQSAGRARGPDGKFISPNAETQGAEAETPETPEGAAEPEKASTGPTGRPVPLKVDGQVYDLPGAFQQDDGTILVTPDGFEQVHRWMGKGIVAEQKLAKMQQQLAEATERTSAEVEWAKMVGERYAEIAMLPEEEQLEYLRAFRQEFPSLRAQAEAEHWKREAERARRASEPDPQMVQAERQQQFAYSFNENFSAMLGQDWAKGLTPDDAAQLKRELEAVADSFLWIADKDYPEQGFQRGEWVFNDTKMAAAVQARAEYLTKLRASQQRVNVAARQNAVARTTKPNAPPIAAPKTVTTSTSATQKAPMTKEEWQKRNMYL